MASLLDVVVPTRDIGRFAPLVGEQAVAEARALAEAVKASLRGAVVWNVNSTAVGGGVAEMIQPLVGYARGLGVDARWVVITGSPEFFRVTKRLHHALHGSRGDGTGLDAAARALYETTLRQNSEEMCGRLRAGDAVILHDPQTAGLAPALLRGGVRVVWRCHVGHDPSNDEVEAGWAFLRDYLDGVDGLVFSRQAYVPQTLTNAHEVLVIPPSIDAFSAKNEDLDDDQVRSILVHVGLVEGPLPSAPRLDFVRADGTPGRIERRADVIRLGRAPSWDTPLVVQVSRWDPLKDMLGVLRGFALARSIGPDSPAFVLAGPNVNAVADDPEGPAVFEQVLEAWRALPQATRHRIHLVNLPLGDIEENAIIVNALQRHASIVVQKSLHEGFGLTVTEAMWKGRAVVASAVGGIQDQIEDEASGVLLPDPTDLAAFAHVIDRLLGDPDGCARLGRGARERVRSRFLGLRHLLAYGHMLSRLAQRNPALVGSR